MRLAASPRAGNLLDWALSYAERGWPVLPVAPRAKRPLTDTGLLEASASRRQILDWWARWPNANIGLRTGVAFDVLDVDGEAGHLALREHFGPDFRHDGPRTETGKGEHWFFLPGGTANRAGLLTKVDWRGTNGYIVAPPSVHPEGHVYGWLRNHGPDSPLEPVPPELLRLLSPYVEREPVIVDPGSYGTTLIDLATQYRLSFRREGADRWRIHCIFHDGDNQASLALYDDQHFYCYGCGAIGGPYDFFVQLDATQSRHRD